MAANAVIRGDSADWDDETMGQLLYAIARDSEVGLLANSLSERQLDLLCAYSLRTDKRDGKWQLAEQLGKHQLTSQRERLLLELAVDADG